MKNKLFLFTIFTALVLALAACGGGDGATGENEGENTNDAATTYEPEDIKETDVCEVCAMAVADNEHATQIVLTNERSIKFDDIGCMYEWIEENGEDDIGTAFVRDYNSEQWFDFTEGTFVFDETIDTPMAYGIISFSDANEAEKFIEDFGKGDMLTYSDLANHEWVMHKEMMGHDHDDHDDHDTDEHNDEEHDEHD